MRQVLGTVEAGKGTVANQMAALNNENQSFASVNGKYIDIQAKKAEIAKTNVEIQHYADEHKNTQQGAAAHDAQAALGQALARSGNDLSAAFEDLRQHNPTAYGTLAAIDAERKSSVQTETTDPQTQEKVKTTTATGLVPQRTIQMVGPDNKVYVVAPGKVSDFKTHGYREWVRLHLALLTHLKLPKTTPQTPLPLAEMVHLTTLTHRLTNV